MKTILRSTCISTAWMTILADPARLLLLRAYMVQTGRFSYICYFVISRANASERWTRGASIHELIDWLFDIPGGGHRPVTLVFAKERSELGVKEALFEGRTVAWYQNSLIGQEKYLIPLIESSLVVDTAYYQMYGNKETQIANVVIFNHSDATYLLNNESDFSFYHATEIIELNPQTSTTLSVKTIESLSSFELNFEVLNAIYAKKMHPKIRLEINIKP